MDREEFDRLVRAVEEGVGRDRAALRRRTLLLALAGYAGLLAPLLAVLLLAAGFFSALLWGSDPEGKVACAIVGFLLLLGGGPLALHALLARTEPPKGRAVTRAEAPDLYAVLDDLRERLRAAPFHRVWLTPEHNAGVTQIPRLGVLGWPRNHLILGLPLLDSLSPEEMRAVLAHECAHLSRRHGRLSHWLYRLRRSWQISFETAARQPGGGVLGSRRLTQKFVGWFWPRFNAHAFVLSRANEYEADAEAARLAGAGQLAAALVRLQVLDRLLEQKIWPDVWRLAHERATPPDDLLERVRDGLRAGAQGEARDRWVAEAFRAVSNNADTHPCLSERLQALATRADGHSAAAVPSAAEALLGASLGDLRRDTQTFWADAAGAQWREAHGRAAALAGRLGALGTAAAPSAVGTEGMWDRARVLLDLRDHAAAMPLLHELLALRPDHAPARLQLGRLLLESGDASGVAQLEQAMADDDTLVPVACELLHAHHRQTGRADRMREIAARLDRHDKALAAAHAERAAVSATDTFIPHGLAAEELAALRAALSAEPELLGAELVQKQLEHFPQQKFFALCTHRRPAWHRLPSSDAEWALARRLAVRVRLPGRVLVFPPVGPHRALAHKIRAVAGSAVWP